MNSLMNIWYENPIRPAIPDTGICGPLEGFEKIQGDSMSGCRVEGGRSLTNRVKFRYELSKGSTSQVLRGLWKELPEAGTRKTAQSSIGVLPCSKSAVSLQADWQTRLLWYPCESSWDLWIFLGMPIHFNIVTKVFTCHQELWLRWCHKS